MDVARKGSSDYTTGLIAHIAVGNPAVIVIDSFWQLDNLFKCPKSKARRARSERSKHHKRKPQPNCGPKNRNQW